jgi:glycosyltransferase involved in cell wall biosynthesis
MSRETFKPITLSLMPVFTSRIQARAATQKVPSMTTRISSVGEQSLVFPRTTWLSFLLEPNSRAKLLVVGGGGGKTKRYMQLAKELGLSEHVLFLGLVGNVEELYAISDAIILPTLSDPWAMAPIEAMLFGLPAAVSSSQYCGAAEHIRGGEALIIKDPRDSREIAETLSKLMDKDLRVQLSRKGQALAQELTWDRTTASTLSAYKDLLRRKRLEQRV